MCDTIIATSLVTKEGKAIFAKNSDRRPNESQYMLHVPAQEHVEGSSLQCTYISIPQVRKTNATLLSKPFWMWGAEMGVNEHGLTIGNEAVFSKKAANKKPALLGMDLIRLGLERAVTPQEAIRVITKLLEEFGQGGNNVFNAHGQMYYQNSFIIANHEDAWVLETVDREWVARQIKDAHSISNRLSIQSEWNLASEKVPEQKFNYAQERADFLYTTLGNSAYRQNMTQDFLTENSGEISVKSMMEILRHHKNEIPGNSYTQIDICMHTGYGVLRKDQSVASMIAYLDAQTPIVFATGTAAPCTSIFKPFWVDAPPFASAPLPTEKFDPKTLFWSHERLHRAVLLNYSERLAVYKDDRDALEEEFTKGAFALADAPAAERADYSEQCLHRAASAEADWLKRVEMIPAKKVPSRYFGHVTWEKINRSAKMPPQIEA